MDIRRSSRFLAVSILFVLIFVSATTVLDTYAKKVIIKKPTTRIGESLTGPLAERTKKATELKIEEIKLPKLPYKFEYRSDLVINVEKKTHELYTDLLSTLIGDMGGIFLIYSPN